MNILSVGMNEEILTTPFVEKGVALLRDCVATRSIGAIVGSTGTGKTWTLKAMERRYAALGLPGGVIRYRCCQIEAGATRGIRDLLLEIGAGGAMLMNGGSASVQILSRIALREFKQLGIRTILMDEADQWSVQTLAGMLSLYDICAEKGQPITLILAGAERPEKWLGMLPALRSRTLHIEHSANLDEKLSASVLKSWSATLAELVGRLEQGDKSALRVFGKIYKGTAGNFRRLRYFAELVEVNPEMAVDMGRVETVLSKMVNQ